jgi:hypothetical protein
MNSVKYMIGIIFAFSIEQLIMFNFTLEAGL